MGSQHPVAVAAAGESDIAGAVGAEVCEILQGARLDRVPARAFLVGPGGQRPAGKEADMRDVRLVVGRERCGFPRCHVHRVQRRLVASARVEHV
jgi:hypothetical protein